MASKIKTETIQVVEELLAAANPRPGSLFVVGCSTSEITGAHIGKAGNLDIAASVFDGIYPALQDRGIFLAAQCCEHLNRALVVEAEYARLQGLSTVSALPKPEAGGAFAALTWSRFLNPVLVEAVSAQAGLDIGGTLIGMHLMPVAVPLRLSRRTIGEASILSAKTRPKYIGGQRTKYE